METNNNTTDQKVDSQQLKELLSKITQGEWWVDNGYKNGQILPNNCFYLRNDKDEMVATVYKKIDSEMQSLAPTLAKEVIELRNRMKLKDAVNVEVVLKNEKLSNDNRVLRELLNTLRRDLTKYGTIQKDMLPEIEAALNNTNNTTK